MVFRGKDSGGPGDSKLRESRRPSRFRPQIAEGDPLRFSIPGFSQSALPGGPCRQPAPA